MKIADEVIEQIRLQVDILELIQKYVTLKRKGKYYFGLCPFHAEKSPSFSVSPDKQIYYCFGCKAGGDSIQFLMDLEQMTFTEAVTHLAEQIGMEVVVEQGSWNREEDQRLQKIRDILELARKLFHYVLKSTRSGARARHYLQKRKIKSQMIDEFQLGYAPNSFDFLLSFFRKRGYSESLLLEAGLIAAKGEGHTKKYFDRFRDRLIFPIHDLGGKVIGFGGRLLGNKGPKYLNSPETRLFQKGKFLYNFHRARSSIRKTQQVILFEGYMDVISAWQEGIQNGIATLGTALTDSQAKLLARHTETAILCYDADQAGEQATMRGIERLKDLDCVVKVAQMPLGLDPDDYIKKYGKKVFQEQILDRPISLTAFQIESLKKQFHLQDEDQRIKYLSKAIDVISQLPKAIERDHYLRKLAQEFNLSLDALKIELRKAFVKQRKKGSSENMENMRKQIRSNRSLKAAEKAERYLIAYMMKSRSVTQWVKEQIGADFQTEVYAALAAYLYAYYDQFDTSDISHFLRTLPDQKLMSYASELAMLDLPDPINKKELHDYVHQIRVISIKKQIEEKKRLSKEIEKQDPLRAAEISLEIMDLKRKLTQV